MVAGVHSCVFFTPLQSSRPAFHWPPPPKSVYKTFTSNVQPPFAFMRRPQHLTAALAPRINRALHILLARCLFFCELLLQPVDSPSPSVCSSTAFKLRTFEILRKCLLMVGRLLFASVHFALHLSRLSPSNEHLSPSSVSGSSADLTPPRPVCVFECFFENHSPHPFRPLFETSCLRSKHFSLVLYSPALPLVGIQSTDRFRHLSFD